MNAATLYAYAVLGVQLGAEGAAETPEAPPATSWRVFDAGPRQTPPLQGDPEREHAELLVALATGRQPGATRGGRFTSTW